MSEGEEKEHMLWDQQEAQEAEAGSWEKKQSKKRQRQLQEKYQRLKQDQEQQQQQKQRKKEQIQDDNDDGVTIMTKLTQESSLECKESEYNRIDNEDDKYDNNIVIIPTQVLFSMKQNLNWKCKQKQKWQKERCSRKMKIKKKIASMILYVTNEYPTSKDDVSREHETKGILKTIDWQNLKKKKRVPNQWSDNPT